MGLPKTDNPALIDMTVLAQDEKAKPDDEIIEIDSSDNGETETDTKSMIEFDSTSFNFGKHYAGKDLHHTFTFYNRADKTLIIDEIKPS